jgi:para-aminobenzoate synthetase component I
VIQHSVVPLPYHPDGAELFDLIADEPWAMFLDSCRIHGARGRYDLIVAEPVATLVTRGGTTEVHSASGLECTPEDPFTLLRRLLPASSHMDDVPFAGGAVGYFGYDLARRFERLPTLATGEGALPEMALGIYDRAVVIDHDRRASWLVNGGPEVLRRRLCGSNGPTLKRQRKPFRVASPLTVNLDGSAYLAAFERIQGYIRAGDCYQVNLARCFSAECDGDPWLAYRSLRRINPAPFAAYLNLPFAHVLSSSPERFLHVQGRAVETRPIKGTRPRSGHPARDGELARQLRSSAKDQAENLMIVDLLRNDLGKVCQPGSVAVPSLFDVETYATVHHLVSTVTGRLASGRDGLDLLRAAFPGGSVTGAPKLRAMQIIEELEPHRRGVYCGAIGYVGLNGDMDTSIAIRTLVIEQGRLHFCAGGGIVADSRAEEEYQETLHKAAALLRVSEAEPGAEGFAPWASKRRRSAP